MISRRSILLVAPEDQARASLRTALHAGGFAVEAVAPGDLSPGVLEERPAPELVVLDACDDRAWALAGHLSAAPMIVLVPRADQITRAFEAGAEDCVLRTAEPQEIVARADAVLRRTAAHPKGDDTTSVYVDRRLWVNLGSRQVWVRGEPAHLTPREFRLLQHLVKHRDRTLGHDDILASVWGREPSGGRPSEVLKQYVWRLRQKIEADPESPAIVVTVPGAGYRFVSAE